MKYVHNLKTNKLATQPLRELLWTAGQPTTPQEKRVIASLARAYERMGDALPTKQLGNDLDDLYSQAVSVADRAQVALAELAEEHSKLSLEAKGLSMAHITPESLEATVRVWSEAFHAVEHDSAPAIMRCREVQFLALAAASKQIRAALKAAKKK